MEKLSVMEEQVGALKQALTGKSTSDKDTDKKQASEGASVKSLVPSKDISKEELEQIKKKARQEYENYRALQAKIELPVAKISIEEPDKESDKKSDKERTTVYIEASYKKTTYHFKSVGEEHAKDMYTYLNSQPLVRAKYTDGKTVSWESTEKRVGQFSDRFKPGSKDGLYLYSGFVVSDGETGDFLGIANLGGSDKGDGHADMAFLNRPDAWSYVPSGIVEEYNVPKKLSRTYQGVATVEVCTLLQYAACLKKKGYKVGGKDLEDVNATARLDNPGSWKACAKSNMELVDIDQNPTFGPELRYQVRKKIGS